LADEYKWRILLRIAGTWLNTDEISMNFCYLVGSGHVHLNPATHQPSPERASTSACWQRNQHDNPAMLVSHALLNLDN
jgi:hypothetical protein